jgi:cholesterol transport system auxiliary component
MIARLSLLAALASALLGACVSILPEPEAPEALIALPAARAMAPASPLRADVAVYVPDAGRAYAGADIAVASGGELVFLADVRWADAAPRLMQGAVVDALSKAAGQGRAAPAELGARVDYDVRWRIVDLSAGRGVAPVTAAVEVSLMDSLSRRMMAQTLIEETREPASRSPRDRAAALAEAAQAAADRAAEFVAQSAAPRAR